MLGHGLPPSIVLPRSPYEPPILFCKRQPSWACSFLHNKLAGEGVPIGMASSEGQWLSLYIR